MEEGGGTHQKITMNMEEKRKTTEEARRFDEGRVTEEEGRDRARWRQMIHWGFTYTDFIFHEAGC